MRSCQIGHGWSQDIQDPAIHQRIQYVPFEKPAARLKPQRGAIYRPALMGCAKISHGFSINFIRALSAITAFSEAPRSTRR